MPNRGHRGRVRGGNFRNNNPRHNATEIAVRDRLGFRERTGVIPTFSNKIQTSKKYKFKQNPTSVAELPRELEIRETAKNFLRKYYDIFDLEGRTNLESQYNSDAFFSFSATYLLPNIGSGRNLLEVREPVHRVNLLVHSGKKIAESFNSFPPTEHQKINQLTIDIPFYIANPMYIVSMQIIITGVYKDLTQGQTNPLVAFTRVLVIKQVSVDEDNKPIYQIFNDLFMLQPPTPLQIKAFHNQAQFANRVPGAQANTVEDASRSRENMIKSIMNETKMNRAGSQQLLEESKWIIQEALKAFNTLKEANQIPQSFFI